MISCRFLDEILLRSNQHASSINTFICDELKPTCTIKNSETLIKESILEQPSAALKISPSFKTTLSLLMFSTFKFIIFLLIEQEKRIAYRKDLLSLPEFLGSFIGKVQWKYF